MRKYIAELLGTMVLVLLGCGSAVFAGGTADIVGAGTGTIGVALAFGLSVVAMAYCIGNISGCHINPAITFGAWISGRIDTKDAFMYIVFQIVGAIIGAMILSILVGTGGHAGPTMTGANTFDNGETAQAFIAEERRRKHGRTGNRTDTGTDTHCMYPYYRNICKSGKKYRSGHHGRRTGTQPALAVHRSAAGWCGIQLTSMEIHRRRQTLKVRQVIIT